MSKIYTVERTKYGRDWKKLGEGIDSLKLEDDELYTLWFKTEGFIRYVLVKIFWGRVRFKLRVETRL